LKPTLTIAGENIADAWEKALWMLWCEGKEYPGRHWHEGDPVGRQATMIMRVESMCAEPRVHKGFTCTPKDLWDYRKEILEGSDRAWAYTYHDRVQHYPIRSNVAGIDQVAYAMKCLARKLDSHKGVVTLGHPPTDSMGDGTDTHIPCLRHISFEAEKREDNDGYFLNMYTHWRARNALHASFNNMFGLSFLLEQATLDLATQTGLAVVPGGYVDCSDDFHYNGKDFPMVEAFIKMMARPDSEKFWTVAELVDAAVE
jgi:thymidylate synthase